MSGRPLDPVLPLPRQWSRRVRAAIIHAISLASLRGRRGQRLDLVVSYMAGRKHLPIVELKKAA